MSARFLTFGAAFFLLLTVFISGTGIIRQGRGQQNSLLENYETDRALHAFTVNLSDMEDAQRGYLLTGEKGYLQQMDTSQERVRTWQDKLDIETVPPKTRQALFSLMGMVQDRLRELRAPVKMYQEGRRAEAVAIIHADDSLSRMQAVRHQADAMHDQIREDVKALRTDMHVRRGKMDAFMILAAGLSLLLFAGTFAGFARSARRAERAAQTVHQVNENLQRAIQELSHQTQRGAEARRALARTNGELKTFAYSVAHDLRAPLRTIVGFTDILVEEHSTQFDAAGRQVLDRVVQAAQRCGSMIDNLLDLSQVTQRKLAVSQVNIEQVVRSLWADLIEHNPQPPAFVVSALPNVEADEGLLRLAFGNLLENALKFSSKVEHPRIEVGVHREGRRRVTYFVRDNGAGFDQRFVSKLFEPFQRLHSLGEFDGNGIGLAVVKRVVSRHGGAVRAEAHEGQGATFFLTLKRTPEAPEPKEEPSLKVG